MAGDSILPARERGGHQAALKRQAPAPDGICTAVNAVQAADLDPVEDLVLVEPEVSQLPDRDNAMLSIGESGDMRVGLGAKVGHSPTKAPGRAILPLRVRQQVDRSREADGDDGDRVAGVVAQEEGDRGDRADRDDDYP